MIKIRYIAGCLLLLAACLWMLVAALCPVNAGEAERKTLTHRWTAEAAYPQFGEEKTDEAIRQWVEDSISDLVKDANGNATTMWDEAFYEIRIDYKESQPSDNVASVMFTIMTYPSRAAHPMTVVEVKNYFLDSGKSIKLDDLFADSNQALEILANHAKTNVKNYLRENCPAAFENDDYSVLDEDWFVKGSAPTRDNYSSLVLEPGGVRVYYQLYQVLPYVFGLVDSFVPVDALKPAGPSELVWPHPKG